MTKRKSNKIKKIITEPKKISSSKELFFDLDISPKAPLKQTWLTIENLSKSFENSNQELSNMNLKSISLKINSQSTKHIFSIYKSEKNKKNKVKEKYEIAKIRKEEKEKTQKISFHRLLKNKRLNLIEDSKMIFPLIKKKKIKTKRLIEEEIISTKKNNRIIWANLNYRERLIDLTKFRPYLVKSITIPRRRFFLLELLTITSQEWIIDFKHNVETIPFCLSNINKSTLIYLNNIVFFEIKKKHLLQLFRRCNCKTGCFSKQEYSCIISKHKKFEKRFRMRIFEVKENSKMFKSNNELEFQVEQLLIQPNQ